MCKTDKLKKTKTKQNQTKKPPSIILNPVYLFVINRINAYKWEDQKFLVNMAIFAFFVKLNDFNTVLIIHAVRGIL